MLFAFWLIERRVRNPLVPFSIFRRRTLTGATLVSLLLTAITSPPLFFGTLYLQRVTGTSPFVTGLAFLPESLSIVVCSALGAVLTNRIGARKSMIAGMSALIIAMLLLAQLSISDGYLHALLPGLVVLGFGLGVASVAATSAGTGAVNAAEQGLVAGLLNTAAQVGTALGLAILNTIAAADTAALKSSGQTDAPALVAGFRLAFLVSAGFSLLGVLIAAFVVTKRAKQLAQGEDDSREQRNAL